MDKYANAILGGLIGFALGYIIGLTCGFNWTWENHVEPLRDQVEALEVDGG